MPQRRKVTDASTVTVSVISDTHGLLRPQTVTALKGSDLILHAGDIDRPEVLHALKTIAPVAVVRGNCDRGPWADALPLSETLEFGGVIFHMRHNLSQLDLDPKAAGIHILICGHSHIPEITKRDGMLYLNPGSAGPRRFTLPATLVHITIQGKKLSPEIIRLE